MKLHQLNVEKNQQNFVASFDHLYQPTMLFILSYIYCAHFSTTLYAIKYIDINEYEEEDTKQVHHIYRNIHTLKSKQIYMYVQKIAIKKLPHTRQLLTMQYFMK